MASDLFSRIDTGPTRAIERPAASEPRAGTDVKRHVLSEGGNSMPGAQAGEQPDQHSVARAVSELNDYVQSVQRDLQFSVDEASGRTVIKVIDSESKEVIRQIPPEEALFLARRLAESDDGTILSAKV